MRNWIWIKGPGCWVNMNYVACADRSPTGAFSLTMALDPSRQSSLIYTDDEGDCRVLDEWFGAEGIKMP